MIVYSVNVLIYGFPACLDEPLNELVPQGAGFLLVRP